ncbi:MAG: Hsp20/alpha crystallin family protein [Sulfolobales archaeon]
MISGLPLTLLTLPNSRIYYKEVELPAKVDPDTSRATYKNGVLEVKLKKIGKRKEKALR